MTLFLQCESKNWFSMRVFFLFCLREGDLIGQGRVFVDCIRWRPSITVSQVAFCRYWEYFFTNELSLWTEKNPVAYFLCHSRYDFSSYLRIYRPAGYELRNLKVLYSSVGVWGRRRSKTFKLRIRRHGPFLRRIISWGFLKVPHYCPPGSKLQNRKFCLHKI